jgi:sulfite exporter TauE/SafE
MSVKIANRNVRSAGRQAASSRWLQWLARGGLVARGVTYMLVGLLAVQIGFGVGGKIAKTPLGPWLLVAVAFGLVTFGIYSCCEARWRRI